MLREEKSDDKEVERNVVVMQRRIDERQRMRMWK